MKLIFRHIILILLGLFLLTSRCRKDDKVPGVDLRDITYNPTSWEVTLPNDWPELEIPPENPMTEQGIDLGRHLFYDPILSGDNTQSCSSCHKLQGAFTDNMAVSVGIDGIAGELSSMSLVNIGLVKKVDNDGFGIFFWNGRSLTLEEQALEPVTNEIELHNEWSKVIEDLQNSELYRKKFREAFGISNSNEITKELAAKAIAQFERSILSFNSKYDNVQRNKAVYTEDELEGFLRYIDSDEIPFSKQMECSHCHTLPLTTSNNFDNNALQLANSLEEFANIGRGEITGNIAQNGMFRVPTLRNIMASAPYMHNGSLTTIDDVLHHYTTGGNYSPNASPFVRDAAFAERKSFAEEDILYMKAFLRTFTDTSFLNNPKFQNPF